MARKTLQLGGLMSVLALFSAQVSALPFSPIEPRSFALGGTGVSSGSNANAGFLNPALLAVNERDEALVLHAPILGYRYFDKQNVMDSLANYQRIGAESAYDTALNDFNNAININESLVNIGGWANVMRTRIPDLANKAVQQEFMAAAVVGIPHEKLNMTFSLSSRVLGGGVVDIADSDLTELDRIIKAAGDASLLSGELFDSRAFASRFRGRGLSTTELALSMARQYSFAGHDIAVGVTPKYIQATSFDYATYIDAADYETDLNEKSHSAFDVDVGAAKSYGNGWSTGVAIKNLIGQKYQTSLGNEIRIKPQARIGISHAMKWVAVAVDMDLNKSQSLGFDSETQYLGIGAELNVFDMSTIRIGYRSNMSDVDTSLATVGLGIKVYGVQVDLAAGANEDEIDFAAQASFRF